MCVDACSIKLKTTPRVTFAALGQDNGGGCFCGYLLRLIDRGTRSGKYLFWLGVVICLVQSASESKCERIASWIYPMENGTGFAFWYPCHYRYVRERSIPSIRTTYVGEEFSVQYYAAYVRTYVHTNT